MFFYETADPKTGPENGPHIQAFFFFSYLCQKQGPFCEPHFWAALFVNFRLHRTFFCYDFFAYLLTYNAAECTPDIAWMTVSLYLHRTPRCSQQPVRCRTVHSAQHVWYLHTAYALHYDKANALPPQLRHSCLPLWLYAASSMYSDSVSLPVRTQHSVPTCHFVTSAQCLRAHAPSKQHYTIPRL